MHAINTRNKPGGQQMKIRILLAALLLAASAAPSFAAGPYVGVAGGVSIIHDSDVDEPGYGTFTVEYDTGYGFNASLGHNFDGARLEFEFGYKKADIDKVEGDSVSGWDATFLSYMVNGYLDFKNQSAVTPYLGAGLGFINGEFDNNFEKDDDTVFGYQFMAGLGIALDRNVTIDLSYRFQGAGEDLNIWGADTEYMSSSFFAGLRFNF
jgi:opacity protein-like surface antigen